MRLRGLRHYSTSIKILTLLDQTLSNLSIPQESMLIPSVLVQICLYKKPCLSFCLYRNTPATDLSVTSYDHKEKLYQAFCRIKSKPQMALGSAKAGIDFISATKLDRKRSQNRKASVSQYVLNQKTGYD
jgi:hypothetical protein